jgi:nucleotide-binding universal stress UspA family protein
MARASGIEADAHVLEGTSVARTIADLAEHTMTDLVVVGRHAKGWMERMWTGSESARMHEWVRGSGLLVCPITG